MAESDEISSSIKSSPTVQAEKIITNFNKRNEARKKVVIISMLSFGFVYACHLIKESVIFLQDVWEDGQMYLNEADIQFFIICWILFLLLVVLGLWIFVYIWLKSRVSERVATQDKNE